jgi:hypothetical protein
LFVPAEVENTWKNRFRFFSVAHQQPSVHDIEPCWWVPSYVVVRTSLSLL